MFEKVKLKDMRVHVVEGQLVFAVKLKETEANIVCGKLHRQNSNMDKNGFSFDESNDILIYSPEQETLPIELGDVRRAFEEVIRN